ncbi:MULTISPECIES: winged helix-turn-helix domain-containing protein [Gammaproteobacteria]|uniref:winged helix-turn-helix domain-containing protein n=1 Tax=Gammaproteobacteria TaxID=1236 RepID=UPI0031F4C73F
MVRTPLPIAHHAKYWDQINMAKKPSNIQAPQAPQTSISIPLNINPEQDSYVIKGGAGLAVAHVKKPSGEVFSMHVRANGAFQTMTHFNPSMLTVEERRKLEFDLYNKGHTQADIADLVGVSQPTVAHDLKKLKEK